MMIADGVELPCRYLNLFNFVLSFMDMLSYDYSSCHQDSWQRLSLYVCKSRYDSVNTGNDWCVAFSGVCQPTRNGL